MLPETVGSPLLIENGSAGLKKKPTVIRDEAIDLAFALDPLHITQPNDCRSVAEAECAIDFVLQAILETVRPVHRTMERTPYQLMEVTIDENSPSELGKELSALDELFALL